MRLRLDDTPVYKDLKSKVSAPVNPYKRFGLSGLGAIGLAIAFASATGLGYYYFATYFNTYLSANAGFDRPSAILISLVSLVLYGACTPFVGMLSDRFGRKRMFVFGFFAMAVYSIPVFLLLQSGHAGAWVGVLIFGVLESILNVLTVVVLPEIFTAATRVTGGAIGYNIGIGFISGSGPLVAAALVQGTGNALAPGFYLGGIMLVVAIIILVWLPETSKRSLYMQEGDR